MKLVRFSHGQKVGYGIREEDAIKELSGPPETVLEQGYTLTGAVYSPDEVHLLSPVSPGKVICLGLNYRRHAEELNFPVPDSPIIFMKPSTAVIGPGQDIIHPPQVKQVDYEAELGVVIGKRCYRAARQEALSHVLGYTCANDVTARDYQYPGGQWTYAKSFDTFCPLGPWIETEIDDPEDLPVRGYLNGKLVQDGSTAEHVFKVDYIIHYVSHCMTLLPGDVIMTGTPFGIGPMQPGDTFTVEIPPIGKLENRVISN